jgi:hypothetical protein
MLSSRMSIVANEFTVLAATLRSAGVTELEIIELRKAMREDQKDVLKYRTVGPRVAEWIGQMVGRAATGSWQISPHAGGTFLADEISSYYGF